jgi:hypothetical protein
MRKWLVLWRKSVNDLLPLINIEGEKRVIHHWPFSRWYHVTLVSIVAYTIAPKELRVEAARAALVHDHDNVIITDIINSWKSLWVYWLYLTTRTSKPDEPARFARSIGLSEPAVEAVRDHMKKANPKMWFRNPLTRILMAADALGHMSEYILWPFFYGRIRRIQ